MDEQENAGELDALDHAEPTSGHRKSGYSIYNVEQRRRRKVQPLPDIYPPMPAKKYDVIYADPPWDYGGKMQFDKTSIKDVNVGFKRDIFISSAEFKYPTLKLEQLAQIKVQDICKDDCLLFLWTTSPHLAQSLKLGVAWGFEYRTVAFIWDKMVHNPGKYTLSNCELCLVFKHGRIPLPRGARNVKQLIRSPRKGHSVKPDEVRDSIVRMWPSQDRIELFARRSIKGWDTWGLDLTEPGAQTTRTGNPRRCLQRHHLTEMGHAWLMTQEKCAPSTSSAD